RPENINGLTAGASTRKKFFEFFTVPIRNAHTRAAYYRAIEQFLAWCERAGCRDLEDIEPITVAAYIETLQRRAAPPTVKRFPSLHDTLNASIRPHSQQNEQATIWPTFIFHRRIALGL